MIEGIEPPARATPAAERTAESPLSDRGLAILLGLTALVTVAVVVVPVLLLRPFSPQTPATVAAAYALRTASPWLAPCGAALVALLGALFLRRRPGRFPSAAAVLAVGAAGGAAWLSFQNHFEWMFAPLPSAEYARARDATFVGDADMVVAVEVKGDAVAYPVRQMAYHHLLNDEVGQLPVVSTYWTLCHTALVWERTVDGRALRFRLFGINNQNFIMRDEETGSWWQQVTGEALHGPLKGRRLRPVFHDEISFAVFRRERPMGRVLRPDPGFADEYADWNWEKQMKKTRTVRPKGKDDPLEPRAVVVGVRIGEAARAYPFPLLRQQSPIADRLGGEPILLVVGDDKKSVRVFKCALDGRPLSFARRVGVRPLRLVDTETGTEWDFSGAAVLGTLAGRRLEKVRALKEYWFDWKTYNPGTGVYVAGARAAP